MAGDWIKMRSNLWDDPRVSALCDATNQPEAMVIGALYWLWSAADQHTEDGIMPGLSLRQIDRKTGVPGFAQALCNIGWMADHPEGVRICNFTEHNGESAKKRCQTAKRVAKSRSCNAGVAQEALQDEQEVVTDALAREREREEKEITTSSTGVDRCPVAEIIKLFGEHAPSLVQPRIIPDAVRAQISARWRESENHQDLDFWQRFFAFCEQSDFLAGRTDGRGGKPFRAGLEWIVKASNFAKIINGNYHTEVAA
jgi:hypothetical protein